MSNTDISMPIAKGGPMIASTTAATLTLAISHDQAQEALA